MLFFIFAGSGKRDRIWIHSTAFKCSIRILSFAKPIFFSLLPGVEPKITEAEFHS